MALQFHVNGLAELQYLANDTFTNVGYSTDGVTIELHNETEDVFTDKWGPKIPEDVLNYGQWATVKMQLVKYDTRALEDLEGRLQAAQGTAPGLYPNIASSNGSLLIGTLYGQCDEFTPIAILRGHNVGCENTPLEGGWQFNAAYLADIDSFKIGTRVTVHDLTFRCLPDASGVLFTNIGSGAPVPPS